MSMEDIRVYISKFLNNQLIKREKKALKLLDKYIQENDLSECEYNKLYSQFWSHLRYNVDEYDHADIETYSMALAQKKEEASGREDLYLWWFITIYYYEIVKWKFHKLFGIS
jgi:DNA repair ATPase RecN